jgi:hypothetical protein
VLGWRKIDWQKLSSATSDRSISKLNGSGSHKKILLCEIVHPKSFSFISSKHLEYLVCEQFMCQAMVSFQQAYSLKKDVEKGGHVHIVDKP